MPPAPPGTAPPPPSSWWRRHRWVLTGCAAVALGGLAAGIVVWRTAESGSGPDRRPFYAAVNALAATPALRYRSAVGDGLDLDVRVTQGGEQVGTLSLAGQKFGVLTVGGTTYVKPPDGLLPDSPGGSESGATAGALKGRWVTGGAASDLTSQSAQAAGTPGALANRLLKALDAKGAVIPAAGKGRTTVDGTAAIEATTPIGAVDVTRTAPYRVLRIAPAATAGGTPSLPELPSLPSIPSIPSLPSVPAVPSLDLPSLPSLPSAEDGPAPAVRPAAAAGTAEPAPQPAAAPASAARRAWSAARYALTASAAGAATLDLPQLSASDFTAMWNELESDTKQLSKAVDDGIQYSLKGQADLKCGSGGCSVTATVSGQVSDSDPRAKVSGGTAEAMLTATVEIEGTPAGGCTATAPLPLRGTGRIACEDAAAGPVFEEEDAEQKAIAEEESEAEDGATVTYTVDCTGEAVVEAIAQVDVQELVDQEESEHWYARYPGPLDWDDPYGPYIATDPGAEPSRSVPPPPDDDIDDPSGCVGDRPGDAETVGHGWIHNTTGPNGRTETGTACLVTPVTGHDTAPSGTPVGLAKAQATAARHGLPTTEVTRCHIIPARFKGSNSKASNLSPCWQYNVNVGRAGMSGFEDTVGRDMAAAPAGTVVLYTVAPTFTSGASTIPNGYVMNAVFATPSGTELWVENARVPNQKTVKGTTVNLGD